MYIYINRRGVGVGNGLLVVIGIDVAIPVLRWIGGGSGVAGVRVRTWS